MLMSNFYKCINKVKKILHLYMESKQFVTRIENRLRFGVLVCVADNGGGGFPCFVKKKILKCYKKALKMLENDIKSREWYLKIASGRKFLTQAIILGQNFMKMFPVLHYTITVYTQKLRIRLPFPPSDIFFTLRGE